MGHVKVNIYLEDIILELAKSIRTVCNRMTRMHLTYVPWTRRAGSFALCLISLEINHYLENSYTDFDKPDAVIMYNYVLWFSNHAYVLCCEWVDAQTNKQTQNFQVTEGTVHASKGVEVC